MGALPLILVPGLMCDHTVWDPLQPYLPVQNASRVVDHGDANSLVQMAMQLLQHAPPKFCWQGTPWGPVITDCP